ncbi:MAG: hypothetical protein M3Z22_01035 [Verrucomicrobiota bacterium]|nr:hypothetical protein [Verrucomicrobiota bacterium]
MSLSIRCLFVLMLLSVACMRDATGETLPQYRPALLGHHKLSLVNLINTESLMKHGQKDAVIMFSCSVTSLGDAGYGLTYRESPDAELLKTEVLARIYQAQFEPAVYNHAKVGAWVSGTVSFIVKDGKPHLRVFLNQEEDDLKNGHDFVAPQFAFVPGNTKFKGIYYPPSAPGHSGVASVQLDVDANGLVQAAKVVYEHPPGMGFGPQTVGPIRDALFIPGFRAGKPVACRFTWSLIFSGPGRQMKTG